MRAELFRGQNTEMPRKRCENGMIICSGGQTGSQLIFWRRRAVSCHALRKLTSSRCQIPCGVGGQMESRAHATAPAATRSRCWLVNRLPTMDLRGFGSGAKGSRVRDYGAKDRPGYLREGDKPSLSSTWRVRWAMWAAARRSSCSMDGGGKRGGGAKKLLAECGVAVPLRILQRMLALRRGAAQRSSPRSV